jgi:DNA repair exonuclease SbcCD ATPase subunit
MRLRHLRLQGITEAFPNDVCVDFEMLGEGLIAIVGENGAGKSTLIGSIFAALLLLCSTIRLPKFSVCPT